MTSIADFSDNPKHTIKNVSFQTGIRPITLRAWERRYAVPTPSRSDNRYRLYSDRDIAILRWLKSQLYNGISISTAVDELRQMTTKGIWPDVIPQSPALVPVESANLPAKYAHEVYLALIHHDEIEAGNLLRETFSSFDLLTIISKVLTPCLGELGEAWARGEIRITTEHFASAFLRGKLLTLLQSYPAHRNAPFVMVGGAPTEQHEIGALMMAVLLRSEGYRVEFLGPDIPLDDLVDYARSEKPALIILTASTRTAALEMKYLHEKLTRRLPSPLFGFGGLAFITEPELRNQVPGIFLGESMMSALEAIDGLLGSGRRSDSRGKSAARTH